MAFDYKLDWNAESVIRAIEGAVEVASKKGAEMVAADARRLCPEDKTGKTDKWGNRPGSLKASIQVRKSKFEDGGYLVTVGGKGSWGDPFYASFVELGTDWTTAKPFMRPALKRNKAKIKKIFVDALT